jgi:ribulose bisphosphate carboxylase small subunit
VIGYRIWLNGFEVATTAETEAKLRWFNEDSGQHVVQIRAIDAAGNQSRSSPTLVVVRPSPEPTSTPSESPTPTPGPTQSDRPAAQASNSPDPTGHRSSESKRQQR